MAITEDYLNLSSILSRKGYKSKPRAKENGQTGRLVGICTEPVLLQSTQSSTQSSDRLYQFIS